MQTCYEYPVCSPISGCSIITTCTPSLGTDGLLTIPENEFSLNRGNYSPDNARRLCDWLNGGTCNLNGLALVPGLETSQVIPPDQIQQLRLQCYAGDIAACYTLALALSHYCRNQGDRTACREIADLCDLYGGNGDPRLCHHELRQTCDDDTYATLYNNYKDACSSSSVCAPGESCATKALKAAAALACAEGRRIHRIRCTGGAADENHLRQEAIKDGHFIECIRQYIADGCPLQALNNDVREEISRRYLIIAA